MHRLICLPLAAAGATAASAAAVSGVDVFRTACVAGEARFAPGAVTPAARSDLPRAVRSTLSASEGDRIYRLPGDPPGFLIVQDTKASERTCAVAAAGIRFSDAVAAMTGRGITASARTVLDGETQYNATNADGSRIRGRVVRPSYVVMARTTARH